MLMPKRTKFRKAHRNVSHGHATAGHTIVFGDYALMAVADAWLDSRQIESARRALTNFTKRGAKIWIRIFPHKPITAKPAETRMGSGKGAPDHWVAVVKPGTILFEMSGVSQEIATEALRRAGHKMPMDVRVVSRAESTVTLPEDEPTAPVEETA